MAKQNRTVLNYNMFLLAIIKWCAFSTLWHSCVCVYIIWERWIRKERSLFCVCVCVQNPVQWHRFLFVLSHYCYTQYHTVVADFFFFIARQSGPAANTDIIDLRSALMHTSMKKPCVYLWLRFIGEHIINKTVDYYCQIEMMWVSFLVFLLLLCTVVNWLLTYSSCKWQIHFIIVLHHHFTFACYVFILLLLLDLLLLLLLFIDL